MKANSVLYHVEVFVKKCKIAIQEKGSIGLLLRVGRNITNLTDPKPITNSNINFNVLMQLNCDQSAIDTQRCTLTLNLMNSQISRKVIGIVLINLPEIGKTLQKSYKITQTPDKQAQIQVSIKISQVEDRINLHKQPSNKLKNSNIFGQLLLTSNKNYGKQQEKPTSPPSESNKLGLKSKHSESQSMIIGDLQQSIQALQRQKCLLKQLLQLQIRKSKQAYDFIADIATLIGSTNSYQSGKSQLKFNKQYFNDIANIKQQSDEVKTKTNINKLPVYADKQFGGLSKVKSVGNFRGKSQYIESQKSSIKDILLNFQSIIQDSFKSRKDLKLSLQKISNIKKLDIEGNKVRILKTKIDRSYINLLGKQSLTKDQILKHKIEVNKILDELNYSK